MEATVSDKILRFLAVIDGDGSGSGYGDGSGYGSGSGYGDGSGSGYGSGYGDGIKTFCRRAVFVIDGVSTLINSVFGNTAKGEMLNSDLTTTPCYIARRGNCFGHGETLIEAVQAAEDKLFDDMPVEDRLKAFWECHERGVKYPAMDFFSWHHRLTGSCEMGRKSFAANNGVDLDHDMYTVEEFVKICGNSFGGDVVQRLLEE